MKDTFTDQVVMQWGLAQQQAGGCEEGAVSILATALAFATADAHLSLEEVLSRVSDDHATALKVNPASQ